MARTTTPSSKHFEREVAKYNETIEEVEAWLEKIDDEECRNLFLQDITDKNAKAKALIANQGAIWFERLQEKKGKEIQTKLDELSKAEEILRRGQEEARKQAKIQEITDGILHGDATQLMFDAPKGFKLLLIDPPY